MCYRCHMSDDDTISTDGAMTSWVLGNLTNIAFNISVLYFGCPVYLVGSALHSATPRDIDIVVVVDDEAFAACYGDFGSAWRKATVDKFVDEWTKYHTCMVNGEPSMAYQRWASECSKRSRSMTMALHKRVDFKVQPLSYSESLSAERKLLAQAK